MFGCPPVCLDVPSVWTPPVCFGTLLFGCTLYVWTPPVCLDDVWMPTVHTNHKESMLCHTKGVSICTHTLGCPLYISMPPYVWIPPVCVQASHMFGPPLYVWMPPVCLNTLMYVWVMFGCPCTYTTHRKHAMSH